MYSRFIPSFLQHDNVPSSPVNVSTQCERYFVVVVQSVCMPMRQAVAEIVYIEQFD